ncbi:single stranded DNA-binding domain-containing protein [Flavobacterium hydrophilum]|uniref:Uncharacterized protein n=1 Tax=Flavobacterium hydrophilum TaxID=2211445 RepID=A0A2V4BZ43_9FLAO|nr:hypothetical protein [Flavobacterium hydrophilum]PXY44298.1 hypothetical protein DMB68_17920 [Flavobacterium hydrophilum]
MLKNYLILFIVLATLSCKKASAPPPPQINSFYKKVITADDRKTITPEEAKTYHVDKTYQYEYRTGYSQHYEYNYDVKGINAKGDSVFGNINVEGKYGAGILINDSLGEIEINTEWIAYGKLKAIDKKRNEYHLIVK